MTGRCSMLAKPNRLHKRKLKRGSGCKICKPHKGRWAKRWKPRDVSLMDTL